MGELKNKHARNSVFHISLHIYNSKINKTAIYIIPIRDLRAGTSVVLKECYGWHLFLRWKPTHLLTEVTVERWDGTGTSRTLSFLQDGCFLCIPKKRLQTWCLNISVFIPRQQIHLIRKFECTQGKSLSLSSICLSTYLTLCLLSFNRTVVSTKVFIPSFVLSHWSQIFWWCPLAINLLSVYNWFFLNYYK